MADRALGMRHVSDRALQRLAGSLPDRILPVLAVSPLECRGLGFVADAAVRGAEAWLVVEGQRVARLNLPW